jgi:hypothetical protein
MHEGGGHHDLERKMMVAEIARDALRTNLDKLTGITSTATFQKAVQGTGFSSA